MIATITVIKAKNGFVITSVLEDGTGPGPMFICPNLDKLPEVARKIFNTGNEVVPVRLTRKPAVVQEVDEDEDED